MPQGQLLGFGAPVIITAKSGVNARAKLTGKAEPMPAIGDQFQRQRQPAQNLSRL